MKKHGFILIFTLHLQGIFAQDTAYLNIRNKYMEGNYTGVISEGMKLMFSEPKNQESYVVFGAALMQIGELEEASEYIKKSRQYPCSDIDFCADVIEKQLVENKTIQNALEQGVKLFKEGKDDSAYLLMMKAYRDYPEKGLECAVLLMENLLDKKLYLKAIDLNHLLSKDKREEVQKMANTINTKLNLLPEVTTEIQYNKNYDNASRNFNSGNYQTALSYYEKCLSTFPDKNDVNNKINICKDYIAYTHAEKTNTISALEGYVNEYPFGIHSEKVNNKLKSNYLRFAREYKIAGDYINATNYYNKYLNRFSSGAETQNVLRELCQLNYEAGNYYKNKRNFATAAEYYQNALNCNHAEVKTNMVNRMIFKDKLQRKSNHISLGWQTNPNIVYGIFNSFQNTRNLGFNYSVLLQKPFLSSSTYWETDNNNTINSSNTSIYRYSGKSDYKLFCVHAGITKRIIHPLAFYTNFGITHFQEYKMFYWKPGSVDYDEWVKNKDKRVTTPSVDFGLELVLNPICLRFGLTKPFKSVPLDKSYLPNFAIGFVL